MPAILSRPLRREPTREPTEEPTPLLFEDASQQDAEQARSACARALRVRRAIGVVCASLSFLLLGIALVPFVTEALAVAHVTQQALLASSTDLAHHTFLRPTDTASTQDAAGVTASGKPTACSPGGRDALGENLVIDVQTWVCGDVTVYAGN